MRTGVCLLAAVGSLSPIPAVADEWPHDRVGAFVIGAPLDVAGLGPEWEISDGGNRLECARLQGGSLPAGLGMMVIDGRIARFEIGSTGAAVTDPQPEAPYGLRIGMSLRHAALLFPDAPLDLDFHKYAWPPGVYLSWLDGTGNRGVRVEVPDDTVAVILWGLADAVTLSEGCS